VLPSGALADGFGCTFDLTEPEWLARAPTTTREGAGAPRDRECPNWLASRAVRGHHGSHLRILVAITGASGALYAQRLLDNLDPRQHEVHVVLSNYAQTVIAQELPEGLRLPDGVKSHGLKSMNAPFASGSNPPDVMVVIPCTMGTMGRIAHGYSEDVLLRAADVVLKEKKKLILVPRETPLSLVHIKNMELLLLAGATIMPANPIFYTNPKTIQEVIDTVVARVLDHIGIANKLAPRWAEEME
jgi:4-hydroxy-3-polyprenylbenzoate decarboxylase